SVSPGGSEIAFVSGGDIWTAPVGGGEARLLVSHPASESRPLYSPDGKRLAFVSTRTGNGDIYLLTFETGEVKRLSFADASGKLGGGVAGGAVNLFLLDEPRHCGDERSFPRQGRRRDADASQRRSLRQRILGRASARREQHRLHSARPQLGAVVAQRPQPPRR